MTDYKQLCVELLAALENEGYAHWIRHTPDEDELCLRARAALAESEPEGPTGVANNCPLGTANNLRAALRPSTIPETVEVDGHTYRLVK